MPKGRPRENSRRSGLNGKVRAVDHSKKNSAEKSAIQVAAAIIEREGRLLITQRMAGDHLGGFWEFPGGKREAGENFEACLERELREELGIDVKVGRELKKVRHTYPERKVEIRFFECRLSGGEPAPRGCEAFRWVAPHELSNFSFPPADFKLIQELSQRTLSRRLERRAEKNPCGG